MKFWNSLLTVSIGAAIAQIAPITMLPLIARVYTVEAYGEFAAALSLVTIFLQSSSLRLHIPLANSKSENEAKILLQACHSILMISSCFIFSISIIYLSIGHSNWPLEKILSQAVFCLLALYLGGMIILIESLFNYHRNYHGMSGVKILRGVSVPSMQLSLGFFSTQAGMFFGFLVGTAIAVFYGFKRNFLQFSFLIPMVSSLFQEFNKRSKDLISGSSAAFLNGAALGVPIIVAASAYTSQEAGLYALARQIVVAPLMFISFAIYNLNIRQMGDMAGDKKANSRYVIKISSILAVVALLCFAVLYMWSELIISELFGGKWKGAAVVIVWISASYVFRFPASSLSSTLETRGYSTVMFGWTTLYFLLTLIAVYLAYNGVSFLDFIKILALRDVFAYSILLALIYNAAISPVDGVKTQ